MRHNFNHFTNGYSSRTQVIAKRLIDAVVLENSGVVGFLCEIRSCNLTFLNRTMANDSLHLYHGDFIDLTDECPRAESPSLAKSYPNISDIGAEVTCQNIPTKDVQQHSSTSTYSSVHPALKWGPNYKNLNVTRVVTKNRSSLPVQSLSRRLTKVQPTVYVNSILKEAPAPPELSSFNTISVEEDDADMSWRQREENLQVMTPSRNLASMRRETSPILKVTGSRQSVLKSNLLSAQPTKTLSSTAAGNTVGSYTVNNRSKKFSEEKAKADNNTASLENYLGGQTIGKVGSYINQNEPPVVVFLDADGEFRVVESKPTEENIADDNPPVKVPVPIIKAQRTSTAKKRSQAKPSLDKPALVSNPLPKNLPENDVNLGVLINRINELEKMVKSQMNAPAQEESKTAPMLQPSRGTNNLSHNENERIYYTGTEHSNLVINNTGCDSEQLFLMPSTSETDCFFPQPESTMQCNVIPVDINTILKRNHKVAQKGNRFKTKTILIRSSEDRCMPFRTAAPNFSKDFKGFSPKDLDLKPYCIEYKRFILKQENIQLYDLVKNHYGGKRRGRKKGTKNKPKKEKPSRIKVNKKETSNSKTNKTSTASKTAKQAVNKNQKLRTGRISLQNKNDQDEIIPKNMGRRATRSEKTDVDPLCDELPQKRVRRQKTIFDPLAYEVADKNIRKTSKVKNTPKKRGGPINTVDHLKDPPYSGMETEYDNVPQTSGVVHKIIEDPFVCFISDDVITDVKNAIKKEVDAPATIKRSRRRKKMDPIVYEIPDSDDEDDDLVTVKRIEILPHNKN